MPENIPPPAPPPAPLPNSGNKSEYDFILNPANAPKKGFAASSMPQRLALVGGGAVVLIIILAVAFSTIFKGGGNAVTELTDLAQQQTEIARVAAIGVQKAQSTATKNFAHTTQLTLISSQQDTLALLASSGKKLGPKALAIKQNPVTDQKLEAAAANSTFDSTFQKEITDQLKIYRSSLQRTFSTASSSSARSLLQDSFNSINLLLEEKTS